jgi:ATP-dependent RNA helicase RhlE
LRRALAEERYHRPTPIQEQAIPPLLRGRDILGSAQTGTGKTAAFVLPILQNLSESRKREQRGKPRVLILAPTRELAAQIGESIAAYGRHLRISKTVIFGGVKQHAQVNSLNRGKHIAVATPGRLLDLMNQGHISLDAVETFVLDEADRMLDMGFLPDIRRVIAKLPRERQSLFFSATLAPEAVNLAKTIVHDPVEIAIAPDKPAVEKIEQTVRFVDQRKKTDLLLQMLDSSNFDKVLVFTRMKHGANRIAKKLNTARIRAEAIHGNKSQASRTRSLDDFKKGRVRVLVATDIAARGIDVDRITHVINFDLPSEPQTYVHRIGRTARAGTEGDAVSFCSAEECGSLRDIERLIGKRIPVELEHEYHSDAARFANGTGTKTNRPKKKYGGARHPRRGPKLQGEFRYSNGRSRGGQRRPR